MTTQAAGTKRDPAVDLALTWLDADQGARRFRARHGVCMAFAIVSHLLVALIALPERAPLVVPEEEKKRILTLNKLPLKPPPPKPPQPAPAQVTAPQPIPIPVMEQPDVPPQIELDIDPVETELDWSDVESAVIDAVPVEPPPFVQSGPLIVDGIDVKPPRLLERVEPEYPLLARRLRESGVVILQAVIDDDGNVREVEALKETPADRGFAAAAIAAVKQWRYQPATEDGAPVAVFFTVRCNFSLE